jgi:hypothetical protein
MNMQAVDLLLLFNFINYIPPIPFGDVYWVDSAQEFMIDNSGNFLIFNPGV